MSGPLREEAERLSRLLALVAREDEHLLAVRQRLLDDDCVVSVARAEALLADTSGIDRLESFGAKFARMQDTVVDKLIPTLLRVAGEGVLAAIDNLGRMERLGLVESADDWIEMRRLRNRLVHEYIEHPADLAQALGRACRFTYVMHDDWLRIRQYAAEHLHVDA
ncbi:hypothetical protein BI364_12430 [Acidihalobacter yilgarnensis]|uniref:DUF86 domain-containing protein n=1 Tax=Acidihalobacter yilgarnensis TaxID=2819280 RepID=A0A1D8IQ77_9GAMM|nr:hypothetical protein [Acidihalobacter yilgarnensis]AOU98658.1 hypothetical protein BI364_12430 [Acidihalobacter yilgarnensis]